MMIIFSCCSCGKQKEILEEEPQDAVVEKDTYVDDNPIVLGLYKNYELQTEYKTTFIKKKDIVVLQTYASNDQKIEYKGNYKDTWLPLWQEKDNDLHYKIGYLLEYTLTDGTVIKQQILSPEDADDYYDYVEIYLYDGVYHSSDSWYSHITTNDFNEDTYMTSIKLTAGSNMEMINTPLKLTAFSYDEDDFDEVGYYKGKSFYSINIRNSN